MKYTAESIQKDRRAKDLNFILALGCVTAGVGFMLLPWLWGGWLIEDTMRRTK